MPGIGRSDIRIRVRYAAAPSALLRSATAAEANRPTTVSATSRATTVTSACAAGATIFVPGTLAAAAASDQDAITQSSASLAHVGRTTSTGTVGTIARQTTIATTIKPTTAVAVLAAAGSADCAFAPNE